MRARSWTLHLGMSAALLSAWACATPAAAQSVVQECSGKTASPERIIAACSRIIERGNREAREARSIAYVNRAWVYYQREQYDLAIADYSDAIALDPNYAGGYN